MNEYSREQVVAEVAGGRAMLAATCGIPDGDIVGFRAPFLQSRPTLRQVCCSVQDATGVWYRMQAGRMPSLTGYCSCPRRGCPLDLLQVLHGAGGFLYDSSLLEEAEGSIARGLAARVWPYSMDGGIPQDCSR